MSVNMNHVIFVMKQTFLYNRKLGNFLPKKLINFSNNPNLNLVFGLVPLLPTVYAQKEEKDKPNDIKNEITSLREPKKKIESDDDGDKKSGWERVCDMYSTDEFGNLSKEVCATYQSTCIAFLMGCIYGGVSHSREAYIDFMERNQASIFESPYDAKRRLQNHVTMHFMRGAARWGIKISLFTGGFMLFLTTMGVYRGYYSVLDYTLSGIVIGSLLRFRLGPPATMVGGVVGGAMGAFSGTLTNLLFYLQGSSLDDMISFQYELDRRRHNMYLQNRNKSQESQIDESVLLLVKANDQKKIEEPTI